MALTGAAQRKVIVRTAVILGLITLFEFFVAFTWQGMASGVGVSLETGKLMKNALFIILTLFKAFYIIAEFMHLKHEVKRLIWTILLPFIFVVWLIIALMVEGNSIGNRSPKQSVSIEQEQRLVSPMVATIENMGVYG